MKLRDRDIDEIASLVLAELVYDKLLETLPLPPAEIKRREKFREKQKQDRERDNERHADRVRDQQQRELDKMSEEDTQLEFNKLHGDDGKFVSNKKDAKCYSSQWTDGSISRMPGRKAVSRKGGVGRKTKHGGKGKNKCKSPAKKK
tara:strand:- start:542 stop:979 length:438 start_codon:yes stop_codon:yes gene_type:complete